MFRKLVHISISILLLTVTAGFTVSKHYCGPRLVTVSINHEAESCCNMDNCCHNETELFQLEEDFVSSPALQNDLINSIDLFVVNYNFIETTSISEKYNKIFIPESPPPKKMQSILSGLQSYLC